MKFYVISLKRSADRLQHVGQQFARFGCRITPVEACDGAELSPDEAAAHYHKGYYRLLRDDEIACFLSHRRCWAEIAQGTEDYGFVFEDDVYLSSLFPDFLETRLWEKGFGLLSLEQFYPVLPVIPKPVLEQGRFKVYRCTNNNPGAAGYVVSKPFAALLLQHSEVFHHLVDSFLFSPRRLISFLYGSYQLSPAICIQGRINPDFAAKHYVYPTSMRGRQNLAAFSPVAKKDLRYYWQRARIYRAFLRDKFWQKNLPIDFIE